MEQITSCSAVPRTASHMIERIKSEHSHTYRMVAAKNFQNILRSGRTGSSRWGSRSSGTSRDSMRRRAPYLQRALLERPPASPNVPFHTSCLQRPGRHPPPPPLKSPATCSTVEHQQPQGLHWRSEGFGANRRPRKTADFQPPNALSTTSALVPTRLV